MRRHCLDTRQRSGSEPRAVAEQRTTGNRLSLNPHLKIELGSVTRRLACIELELVDGDFDRVMCRKTPTDGHRFIQIGISLMLTCDDYLCGPPFR